MKIYLDNSFLNRPFDDPTITTNRLEADILFFILDLLHNGKLTLVNSSAIEYENSLNPFPDRKVFVEKIMEKATVYKNLNLETKQRALNLEKELRLTPIDALHIAAAEAASVAFFITCDYNLIKRYTGTITVVRPVQFIKSYENNY